jgi:hypothetical protein
VETLIVISTHAMSIISMVTVHGSLGGHLTDLKIWLFNLPGVKKAKNITNTCEKAWKIISHKKL